MGIIRITLLKLQALKLISTLFEHRELDQKDANEKFKIAVDSKKRLRSKFIGSVHSANTRLEAKKSELIKEIGSPEKILAYGKAGTVGLNGEIEHASAFIHTLRFGNKFRDAVGGTSYLSFTNTRGPAGSKISIPMMHKTDSGLRPYYLTHEFTIHDAPFDDEIVIAIGGASSGRAHARTGDRYQDMKEMGIEPK